MEGTSSRRSETGLAGIAIPDIEHRARNRPLGESFVERVWEIACRYTLPGATNGVRLVPASLEDDSGIIGAAALAKARIAGE